MHIEPKRPRPTDCFFRRPDFFLLQSFTNPTRPSAPKRAKHAENYPDCRLCRRPLHRHRQRHALASARRFRLFQSLYHRQARHHGAQNMGISAETTAAPPPKTSSSAVRRIIRPKAPKWRKVWVGLWRCVPTRRKSSSWAARKSTPKPCRWPPTCA